VRACHLLVRLARALSRNVEEGGIGLDAVRAPGVPGQQHRVSHSDIGDQRADPDPFRICRQRGERGPCLEDRQTVWHRLVCEPDGVEPNHLRELCVAS